MGKVSRPRCHILLLMPTKQVSLLSFFLDDPHMIFQYLPFLENIYSYIWSGLWWSTTWLRLLHSLEIWRREKAWEEERSKSKKYSQVEDYELLREVEINVLDIEHHTCFSSLQDSGESLWARRYEWTSGAIVKKKPLKAIFYQVKGDIYTWKMYKFGHDPLAGGRGKGVVLHVLKMSHLDTVATMLHLCTFARITAPKCSYNACFC